MNSEGEVSTWQTVKSWAIDAAKWTLHQRKALLVLAALGFLGWLQLFGVEATFDYPFPPRWIWHTFLVRVVRMDVFFPSSAFVVGLSCIGLLLLSERRHSVLGRWHWLFWVWLFGTGIVYAFPAVRLAIQFFVKGQIQTVKGIMPVLALSHYLHFPAWLFLLLWIIRRWHEGEGLKDDAGITVLLLLWVVRFFAEMFDSALISVTGKFELLWRHGEWLSSVVLKRPFECLWRWFGLWALIVAVRYELSIPEAWKELRSLPLKTVLLATAVAISGSAFVEGVCDFIRYLGGYYTLPIGASVSLSPSALMAHGIASFLRFTIFIPFLLIWQPAVLLTAMEDIEEEGSKSADEVEELSGGESGEN